MIDFGKILKRAWHILWNYKVLWIFGILLAVTAGRGGGSGSSYQFSGIDRNNWDNWNKGFDPNSQPAQEWSKMTTWFNQEVAPLLEHPDRNITTWIWIGVGFILFLLVLGVIFAFIRYTSETAILRMVDEYEQTGTKVGFKQGWKLGWSRRAFRIWVIDLLIGLPFILFVFLLGGLGLLVFFAVRNGSEPAVAGSIIASIGCAFLFIFFFALLAVVVGLLRQFFVRAAALEDTSVGESFRRGWTLFKRNWKSASLMWLIMLGIGIGFGIGGMILFFLLIPVYIVLLIPAAIVAAVPGLLAFGLTSIFASGPITWIIGALVALPFFFTTLFAPFALINGWYAIFESNVWTLTYREIKALQSLAAPVIPVEDAQNVEK